MKACNSALSSYSPFCTRPLLDRTEASLIFRFVSRHSSKKTNDSMEVSNRAAAALSMARIALPACRLPSFIIAGFVGTMMQLCHSIPFVPLLQGARSSLYLGNKETLPECIVK